MLLALLPSSSVRAADLPTGTAKGTCTKDGAAPIALHFAGAFVDQKDSDKPTLLILSDIKLPTNAWTSEFDIMESHEKYPFSGAIFFLNKEGEVFRTDFYWKGRQSSVSGYFKLTLDGKAGKELSGSVATTSGDATDPKVDATLHATLK